MFKPRQGTPLFLAIVSFLVSASISYASPVQWSAEAESAYEEVFDFIGRNDCGSYSECFKRANFPYREAFENFSRAHEIQNISSVGWVYYIRLVIGEKFGFPSKISTSVESISDVGLSYNPRISNGNRPSEVTLFAAGQYQLEDLTKLFWGANTSLMRINPANEMSDFYSPKPESIRPGTIYYDAFGAMFVVVSVDHEQTFVKLIRSYVQWMEYKLMFGGHPGSWRAGFGKSKFSQKLGEGFKKWRPYAGDDLQTMRYQSNAEIADASLEQYSLCKGDDGCFVMDEILKRLFAR